MYDRTTNLTRSTSVCARVMRMCSSSDELGSPRSNWTASDCLPERNCGSHKPGTIHVFVRTQTNLTPNMVQQRRQQLFLSGQYIRRVSFIHPVSYELLQWCLPVSFVQGLSTLAITSIRFSENAIEIVVVIWGALCAFNERGATNSGCPSHQGVKVVLPAGHRAVPVTQMTSVLRVRILACSDCKANGERYLLLESLGLKS